MPQKATEAQFSFARAFDSWEELPANAASVFDAAAIWQQ
jgi:hypothetical protein